MVPLAILGGAIIGAMKNALMDKPAERRDLKVAAETARYSPWTGMKPKDVKYASLGGNMIQGGTMGGMMALSNPGMFSSGPQQMPGGPAPTEMGSMGISRTPMSMDEWGEFQPTSTNVWDQMSRRNNNEIALPASHSAYRFG